MIKDELQQLMDLPGDSPAPATEATAAEDQSRGSAGPPANSPSVIGPTAQGLTKER
jgi:hypothetical protein